MWPKDFVYCGLPSGTRAAGTLLQICRNSENIAPMTIFLRKSGAFQTIKVTGELSVYGWRWAFSVCSALRWSDDYKPEGRAHGGCVAWTRSGAMEGRWVWLLLRLLGIKRCHFKSDSGEDYLPLPRARRRGAGRLNVGLCREPTIRKPKPRGLDELYHNISDGSHWTTAQQLQKSQKHR